MVHIECVFVDSLAFYHRIFAVPTFQKLVIWMAIVNTVYMVAIELTLLLQWWIIPADFVILLYGADICSRPIHYVWDQVNPHVHGQCIDLSKFFVSSGSINTLLNLIIFVLVIQLKSGRARVTHVSSQCRFCGGSVFQSGIK